MLPALEPRFVAPLGHRAMPRTVRWLKQLELVLMNGRLRWFSHRLADVLLRHKSYELSVRRLFIDMVHGRSQYSHLQLRFPPDQLCLLSLLLSFDLLGALRMQRRQVCSLLQHLALLVCALEGDALRLHIAYLMLHVLHLCLITEALQHNILLRQLNTNLTGLIIQRTLKLSVNV